MAQPTMLDNVNALLYARSRLIKELCETRQGQTQGGVKWQPTPVNRSYPCPKGVAGCKDTCGYCKVSTKAMCSSLSKDVKGEPCIKGQCKTEGSICKPDGYCYFKWPYLEYHNPTTGREKPCSVNKQCPEGQYCDEYNNLCRSSDTGKCVYGNFLLRNWCLNPKTRDDRPVRGLTDVYPFEYDANQGKCMVSRPYCEYSMGATFGTDEKGRPTCYANAGQQVAEFFIGKTIFRSGRYREWKKFMNKDHVVSEGFKGNLGTPLGTPANEPSRTLLGKDFGGPGVNLYMYGDKVGCDLEEVKAAYPQYVQGGLLRFTKKDLDNDPFKKRLHLLEMFHAFLSPFIITTIAAQTRSDK